MKIERINENQIRCTLTSFDLSVRNLNLGELSYGSEKARSLFREMIQKASNEVGFEAEDIPLMVEAIPLSNESVMLVITKIEDPEELDTRFSKFSPYSDDTSENGLSDLASEILEGAEKLFDLNGDNAIGQTVKELFDKAIVAPHLKGQNEPPKASPAPAPSTRIYAFDSLDRVCEAAAITGQVFTEENSLYKKPDSSRYFLVLKTADSDSAPFVRTSNILSEYGTKIKYDAATVAYYEEHYEVIVRGQALKVLGNL